MHGPWGERYMFGDRCMDAAIGSVDGSVRFHGLTPTSMKLEGLERHQRLIDSYKKLHSARAKAQGGQGGGKSGETGA